MMTNQVLNMIVKVLEIVAAEGTFDSNQVDDPSRRATVNDQILSTCHGHYFSMISYTSVKEIIDQSIKKEWEIKGSFNSIVTRLTIQPEVRL